MTLDTFFIIEPIEDSDDALVHCPKCENGIIVHLETWVKGSGSAQGGPARPCTYCCRSHMIPPPEEYVKPKPEYPLVLKFNPGIIAGKPTTMVVDDTETEKEAMDHAMGQGWELISREPMLK